MPPDHNESAFCELVKLAIDRAKTPEERKGAEDLYSRCCQPAVQPESGGTSPPPKH